MTDWECPNCHGGFPDPEHLGECPWCGQPINGSYEFEPREISRVVKSNDRDDEGPGLLGRFR